MYVAASGLAFGLVFIQNFSLAYFTSINFFGRLTLLISLFSTLYVIFTCGLNAVVLRFFFDKKYTSDPKGFISHIAALWLMFGALLAVLFLATGYFGIVSKKLLAIEYYREFVPIVFASFFYSFVEIFPNLFVAQEKPMKYALCLVTARLTIFTLLHASVLIFNESSFHVALALLLSGLLLNIAGIFLFGILPLSPIRPRQIKEIFVYAFPLMVYALGGIGYSHGYRVIISTWLSYSDLALFSLASQIALVYYLTAASCMNAFSPKAYKALELHHGNPKAIKFYIKLLLVVGLGIGVTVIPASYIFLRYFKDGAFHESASVLPYLLLGQFFFFMYSYNYILCTFYKKTRILTYSMFAGVTVSLSLAFMLIKDGTLLSAALPVATGLFVQFVFSYILTQRVIRRAGYAL